jgi:hypothetical protein
LKLDVQQRAAPNCVDQRIVVWERQADLVDIERNPGRFRIRLAVHPVFHRIGSIRRERPAGVNEAYDPAAFGVLDKKERRPVLVLGINRAAGETPRLIVG